jgi:hypothetical protein
MIVILSRRSVPPEQLLELVFAIIDSDGNGVASRKVRRASVERRLSVSL